MNRIKFMTELASLLQDIPVEERKDAMQYIMIISMMPERNRSSR
mgnify:CR=1 FL=1